MKTNSGLSREQLKETRKVLNKKIKALRRYSSSNETLAEIADIENKLEQIRVELCLRSFTIAEEMGVTR